jgi:hypothetical protein
MCHRVKGTGKYLKGRDCSNLKLGCGIQADLICGVFISSN